MGQSVFDESFSPAEFERRVKTMLQLSGYSVTSETLIGTKRVDLYFEYRLLGKRRRVAVECKRLNALLDHGRLAVILADYSVLFESYLIDELLIVTLNGLTPSAYAMIDGKRNVSHQTLSELTSSVMDFQSYLCGLIESHKRSDVPIYYFRPRTESAADDLEQVVRAWIAGDDARPMAILGGYGMGKTVFAEHLCAVLAEEAINNPAARVPILIRLGEVSSEQSLDGLLARTLTNASPVRNFTLEAFMTLNAEGHFVVVLDGFDEMKHTMTWEEFKYNFSQFNRLVRARSRVLLLGRPTAFLNDEEQRFALHGIRSHAGIEIAESGWPDYVEVTIAPMVEDQVKAFLRPYLRLAIERSGGRAVPQTERSRDAWVEKKIKDLSGEHLADLAARPVQLKMLADILPGYSGSITKLSSPSVLYSLFIDLIIERDLAKVPSRRRFGKAERRTFAQDVAVWLWRQPRKLLLTPDKIPSSFITKHMRRDEDIDAARRDLVRACFLERRLGDALIFPHRSFQEFLVAESMIERLSTRDQEESISINDANEILVKEIGAFFIEMVGVGSLAASHERLEQHRGSIGRALVSGWILSLGGYDGIVARMEQCARKGDNTSPWLVLLLTLAVARTADSSGHLESARDRILRWLADENHLIEAENSARKQHEPCRFAYKDKLLGLLCYMITLGDRVSPDLFLGGIRMYLPDIAKDSHGGVLRNGRLVSSKVHDDERNRDYYRKTFHLLVKMQYSSKRDELDIRGIYPLMCADLKDYCILDDWIVGGTLRSDRECMPITIAGGTQEFQIAHAIASDVLNSLGIG